MWLKHKEPNASYSDSLIELRYSLYMREVNDQYKWLCVDGEAVHLCKSSVEYNYLVKKITEALTNNESVFDVDAAVKKYEASN